MALISSLRVFLSSFWQHKNSVKEKEKRERMNRTNLNLEHEQLFSLVSDRLVEVCSPGIKVLTKTRIITFLALKVSPS